MKSKTKKFVGGFIVLVLALGMLSGCSLKSTNSEKDINLVVAEVNVTKAENFDTETEYSAYTGAISDAAVYKRDLMAYYLNTGYSYVQSGYDYESVFEMLMESLTETELLVQYATLYLLDDISSYKGKSASTVLSEYNACSTTIEKYEYLLVNTRREDDEIDRTLLARYVLYSSVNSSLDSYEQELLEEEDETNGTLSRTTPTNVGVEQDDFYPVDENGELDYNIYTGYPGYTADKSGIYADDKLEGSTRSTRVSAYNSFIKTLRSNYLLDDDDDLKDIMSLSYMQTELENQLKEQVIEQFYSLYEGDLEYLIATDEYLDSCYDEMLKVQSVSYSNPSNFESALDSMSDTSFILYAPSTQTTGGGTYGLVYNILLPFSESQSMTLLDLSSRLTNSAEEDTFDENNYYYERNRLLKNITTTDQRYPWFNGTTDYSFDASESGLEFYDGGDSERTYLFFEDNLTNNVRYKELKAYTGAYTYNGIVTEAADGSYILTPYKLSIDDMLDEFSAYVDYVLDGTGAKVSAIDKNAGYYDVTNFFVDGDKKNDIDYSNFVYATGKIDFGGQSFQLADLMCEDSVYYKAMSAVNELQFAYTTDTSVLSQYIGYSVSAYDTSYIKEFEYAAKQAISDGVGSFVVCAGDYGWHLIYVTATFDNNGGNVYGDSVDWTEKDSEGTFANLFYEYVKDRDLTDATSELRSRLISALCDDSSIILYEDNYKNLLNM